MTALTGPKRFAVQRLKSGLTARDPQYISRESASGKAMKAGTDCPADWTHTIIHSHVLLHCLEPENSGRSEEGVKDVKRQFVTIRTTYTASAPLRGSSLRWGWNDRWRGSYVGT